MNSATDLSAHQVLYNGDWGAMFWSPKLWQPEGGPYSTKTIQRFVELLAQSEVDTFAYTNRRRSA